MLDPDIVSPLPSRQVPYDQKPAVSADTSQPVEADITPQTSHPVSHPLKKFSFVPIIIVILIVVLVFVVFKVFLPLVGQKGTQVVTLNYWGLWEEASIMEGVIADFEAKNPNIKINYKVQQKNDYRTRLSGRLTKNPDTEEVPDIFRIHSSWLPMFINDITPVPAAVSKSIGLDTDYYQVYKNDLVTGGQFLAVPLMFDSLALFYNQDLIEKAQVTLPKTWWDFQTLATKLTVRDSNGRLQIAGVAMGLTDNVDHWNDIFGLLLKQNGVDILKNDTDNKNSLKDVLTYYTNFFTQYQTWDESMPPSTLAFAQGQLAFYFGPSWRVFNIEDLKIPSLRYAITTVPQLAISNSASSSNSEAQLTNIHWATYWVEAVSKKSRHQKEAWKFLEYLSQPDTMEKMYTTASQTRSFGEIYPRKSLSQKIISDSKVKAFISVADNAESGYLSSRTFDGGLNTDLSKYFADAINSLTLNNGELKTIMETLTSGILQVASKYKLK